MFIYIFHIGQIGFFLPIQRIGVICRSCSLGTLINHRTRSERRIVSITIIVVVDTELGLQIQSFHEMESQSSITKNLRTILHSLHPFEQLNGITYTFRAESLFSAIRISLIIENRACINNVRLRIFTIQLNR